MPEISTDDLRRMHVQLTSVSVGPDGEGGDALVERVRLARDKIANLLREREEIYIKNDRLAEDIAEALAERDAAYVEAEALREQAISAHAALDEAGAPACDGVLSGRVAKLAADRDQSNRFLDSAVKKRDTHRSALHRMGTTLTAAGYPAGFSPDEVEQALAAALAEREAAREEIAQAERVLTDAGVWHPGSITEQIGTLVADIKAARAEVETLRATLTEAHATNSRLAADLAQAQVERDHWLRVAQGAEAAAAAANSQMIATLKADLAKAQTDADRRKQVIGEAHEALDAAGIGVGIPAHRIGLLLAENAALRARLAERPAPPDPRDKPVETAAEATVRRLRSYLTLHTGVDYTSDRHVDTDLVGVMVRHFRVAEQSKADLQSQLERAERIAKEQFEHRLSGT